MADPAEIPKPPSAETNRFSREHIAKFFVEGNWQEQVNPAEILEEHNLTAFETEVRKKAAEFARAYLKKYPDSIGAGSVVTDSDSYNIETIYHVTESYKPSNTSIQVFFQEYIGSPAHQNISRISSKMYSVFPLGVLYATNVADEFIELIQMPLKKKPA